MPSYLFWARKRMEYPKKDLHSGKSVWEYYEHEFNKPQRIFIVIRNCCFKGQMYWSCNVMGLVFDFFCTNA